MSESWQSWVEEDEEEEALEGGLVLGREKCLWLPLGTRDTPNQRNLFLAVLELGTWEFHYDRLWHTQQLEDELF